MILNRTRRARDRYRIIPGHMGNAGSPPESPNHKYEIVSGVDRGNGYQEYISVEYFLTEYKHAPEEAKQACREFLRARGFKV